MPNKWKTFDELTVDQRMDAYLFAKKTLLSSIRDGIITPSFQLNSVQIDEMAEEIAENAMYTQDGKPYFDVPSYFYGGCV